MKCELTNKQLIDKAKEWVKKLCETVGRAWTLKVPVDFNNDPDIIFTELCNRLDESTPPVYAMEDGWVKVEDGCEMPEVGSQVLITVDYSEWGKNERRIFIANVHFADELRPYGGLNSLTGSGFLTGIYFSVPHIPNPDAVTHWHPLPPPPSK